ncbi:hypothetical protein [Streptomyces beijiangensis]|uniref:Uncharacterized protein n=2 Tax=Streptomyces TaxID=1883 RepID=A0A8T4IKK5_9ACTN|nr:hypothetical protein [Streptomyces beijiangensis]MBO0518148.1 hypothetical protein [Streptomyces beijiangensis]MBR7672631.1 hypothetical protein [Streptomyces daliensis]
MRTLATPEQAERDSQLPVDMVMPDLDLTEFMTDGPPKPKVRHDGRPDVIWTEEVKWV